MCDLEGSSSKKSCSEKQLNEKRRGAERRLKWIAWWQSWSMNSQRNKSKNAFACSVGFSYICAGGRAICLVLQLMCLSNKKSHSLGFIFSVLRTHEFNVEVISDLWGKINLPSRLHDWTWRIQMQYFPKWQLDANPYL